MKSKTIKRLPKYLKDEEVKNLLDKCEGRRDRIIKIGIVKLKIIFHSSGGTKW